MSEGKVWSHQSMVFMNMTMGPNLIGLVSLHEEENLDTDRQTEEKAM